MRIIEWFDMTVRDQGSDEESKYRGNLRWFMRGEDGLVSGGRYRWLRSRENAVQVQQQGRPEPQQARQTLAKVQDS